MSSHEPIVPMSRILVIYANSDRVMRHSVASMLYSFDTHLSGCEIYYHNAIFNRAPLLPVFTRVDYVIFHHSVTTVWNRLRYQSKIRSWLSYDFGSARKIALMQDEYKNVDLMREFIQRLCIDHVFTLAPKSQWHTLYGEEIVNKGILTQYLGGYLQIVEAMPHGQDQGRDIDIGYRTDWTKMHVKLGKTGLLKRDIAWSVRELAEQKGLNVDIEVGTSHFIKGDQWPLFLQRCRYVIGVPSGSSVLDEHGDIETQLMTSLQRNPNMSEDSLYKTIVAGHDGNLLLEVLSPRHFEAILCGCGQILIESEYNGILRPWEHYLPLKRDFSNLDEVLSLVADESLRLEMVERCKRDIVLSNLYSYQKFVGLVLPGVLQVGGRRKARFYLKFLNAFVEICKSGLIRCLKL